MGRRRNFTYFYDGCYTWVAPPEDLLSGRLVTKIRIATAKFHNPRTGEPVSQRAISILAKIPEPRLSEYVMGKRPISANNLRRLCELLGCQPTDLTGVIETDTLSPDTANLIRLPKKAG